MLRANAMIPKAIVIMLVGILSRWHTIFRNNWQSSQQVYAQRGTRPEINGPRKENKRSSSSNNEYEAIVILVLQLHDEIPGCL